MVERGALTDAGAATVTRLVSACRAATDAMSLRLDVLRLLRRTLPFDAYAWVLTDPVTAVGSSPLADVPWLPRLPTHVRLKYLTPVNRWTALRPDPVGLLHEATHGDLSQSLLWRELLSGEGVTDAASLVTEDRYGCWSFLELWRTGVQPVFDRADAALLRAVAEPLTEALRRCAQHGFVAGGMTGAPTRTGPLVLVLSPELDVRGMTTEVEGYLRALVPTLDDRAPVPAAAYNVAAQLLANEAGVDAMPPTARVLLEGGRLLTVRAARVGGPGDAPARDIAVTIEASSIPERVDLFSRAFALTARERELVGLLATGADTRTLARALFLSEHTVQDHLKAVFAKTGSHSRRELLARVVGT